MRPNLLSIFIPTATTTKTQQQQAKEYICKEPVQSFKTRQRNKLFILRNLYLVLCFLIIKIDSDIKVIGIVLSFMDKSGHIGLF